MKHCNVNSPYCLLYISYFYLSLPDFQNFPGLVAFFQDQCGPGKRLLILENSGNLVNWHNEIPGLSRTCTKPGYSLRQVKWAIPPELIPVLVALSNWEYF